MQQPLKILFKLPSRERPDRCFDALDSIYQNVADLDNFIVLISVDSDDLSMNNTEVKNKLLRYKNIHVVYGESTSKIHAINRDVELIDGWDIIVVSSDDIFFDIYGFDNMIRAELQQNFPDGDGYLHFNERDSGTALNVMTVCDKKYYDRFGYIYHPDYLSLFADNEQMEVAIKLGRYHYIPYAIIQHKNPAYTQYGMARDDLFNRQQEIGWTVDQETYNQRKANNFYL